jgi:tRNA pseudouridine55 synthase
MDSIFTKELLQEGEIMSFDKPYGWTSFYLVNKVRYHLCRQVGIKKLKVGHTGTLDPLATGLLVLCTGKATKLIAEIQDMPKEYITEITLGATTPSFDLETKIDKIFSTGHINKALIQQKIQLFLGKIEQIPPLYSAKNINGVRAYELARTGSNKELRPSSVEMYKIELLNYDAPVLTLKILCSKGTYIRSFARDIGAELNSGGYLSSLRRTKIGKYSIENAKDVEIFLKEIVFL